MRFSLGYVILILVVYALAVARVTRLINADTILDRPRVWVAGRSREAILVAREASAHGQLQRERMFVAAARRWETLMTFIQCPWCIGMWVALLTAWLPVWLIGWPWWVLVPVALAVSHLVGVCAPLAITEEMAIEDDDRA